MDVIVFGVVLGLIVPLLVRVFAHKGHHAGGITAKIWRGYQDYL